MEQNEYKAYASTFVSYLITNLEKDFKHVDKVILYGSVAKGEAANESDVDIFLDTKSKKIEKKCRQIAGDFQESREAALFKVKGVDNEISLKVGELKKWKGLHRSIMSTGIVLWGKYETHEIPSGVQHRVIFSWEGIGKNRGAFLNKLYGYKVKNKKYPGLLEKAKGEKVGKSSLIIPVTSKEEFIFLFKKYQVRAKQREVFME